MNWESIQVHVDFVTTVQKEEKQKVSNSGAQSQVDFPWGQFHTKVTKASFFFSSPCNAISQILGWAFFFCRDLKNLPVRNGRLPPRVGWWFSLV